MNPYRKQSGIALIAALLAVALATTAAVYLTGKNELYKRRTSNLLNSDQAYQYAIAMEYVAMALLYEDRKETKIDALNEDWALAQPTFEIPGGAVTGRLTDLQGLYNLNNFIATTAGTDPTAPVNPSHREFKTLINQFHEQNLEFIDFTAALNDWIDSDIDTFDPNSAEDQYYLGLERPYRAANQAITHISELRLIKDVTDETYQTIRPFITILPQLVTAPVPTPPDPSTVGRGTIPPPVLTSVHTPINVNTAPAEILVSLGLAPNTAAALITERNLKPFETVEEFMTHPIVAATTFDGDILTRISVSSKYFLLEANAQIGQGSANINSVLYRDDSGKMRVLYRAFKAL